MQSLHGFPGSSEQPFRKRDRSPSPSGPATKRRAPSTYTPALYANLPPAFARSLSVEALASGTPTSERSSPGLDWLQQTQDLQLETPPTRDTQQLQDGNSMEDVGMNGGGEDHAMADDDTPPTHSSYVPPPATPLSPHPHSSGSASLAALIAQGSFAHPDPTFVPLAPSPAHPRAPHDAPPLHHHLAGSPHSSGMTPSSSAGSIHSVHHIHSHHYPHPHHAHAPEPTAGDVSMSPTLVKNGAGAGKGGWKVTMGYRPDCEKCVGRVPGHYSHVVYTS
ncbi:hypothetical protein JCM8097_003590 [Rhodosporidiobolus ruineniae]